MGEIVSAYTVSHETGKPRWNNNAGSNTSPLPNIAGQNEGKKSGLFLHLVIAITRQFYVMFAAHVVQY